MSFVVLFHHERNLFGNFYYSVEEKCDTVAKIVKYNPLCSRNYCTRIVKVRVSNKKSNFRAAILPHFLLWMYKSFCLKRKKKNKMKITLGPTEYTVYQKLI